MIDPTMIDLRIAEHRDTTEQANRSAWMLRCATPLLTPRSAMARTFLAAATWLAPGRQDAAPLSTRS
jgi:hypothetical protein